MTVIPGHNPSPRFQPDEDDFEAAMEEVRAMEARREPRLELPRPIDGKGMTKRELVMICEAATVAWDYLVSTGALPPPPPRGKTNARDEWRRTILEGEFGLPSLKQATQEQFNAILGHFQAMAPATSGKAFNSFTRGDGEANKKRKALWKVKEACQQTGLAWPGYPLSIASQQFKAATLDDLSAKQAWALFFTVTGRGRTKAKQGAAPTPQAVNAATVKEYKLKPQPVKTEPISTPPALPYEIPDGDPF
jgi:hypothetical protein